MHDLEPDDQAIRSALEDILASKPFSRSQKQAKFLRYIVEHHLDNPEKQQSSFEIAVTCFARTADDPNDAYVRNIASQTRRSLKHYYNTLDLEPAYIIQLPDKGYLPNISHQSSCLPEVKAQPATASPFATTTSNDSPNRLLPTIAVTPFQCMAGSELHSIMGELMSDSLITSLAKSKYLRAISRRSSVQFNSTALPARELGEKLRCDYLVRGGYYVHRDSLKLQVELCSSEDEEVIWAARLNSSVGALIGETDELIEQALYGVTSHLLKHELQRALSTPLKSLQCHSLLIGGINIMHRGEPAEFQRAREMLELLIQRNPYHPTPYAQLASWGIIQTLRDKDYSEVGSSQTFIQDNIERALERDSLHAIALTGKGVILGQFGGDFRAASVLYEQAIQQSPNEASTFAVLSVAQLYTGSTSQALSTAKRAIAYSPFDPELYFFHTAAAAAAFGDKQYKKAIEHGETSARIYPKHPGNLRTLIASCTALGEHHEAKQHKTKLLQIDPGFNLEQYKTDYPFPVHSETFQRLSHFLQESGIPLGKAASA